MMPNQVHGLSIPLLCLLQVPYLSCNSAQYAGDADMSWFPDVNAGGIAWPDGTGHNLG